MKRIAFILVFSVFVSLFAGCEPQAPMPADPVYLYYRTYSADEEVADSVIDCICVSRNDLAEDMVSLLNTYFQGTDEDNFVQTFPMGTRVVNYEVVNGVVFLTLTDDFALLTDLDLNIACACIAMTVLKITSAYSISISARSATLDGSKQIVMDRSNLEFTENYTPQST